MAPQYIHERPDWPRFRWDADRLLEGLSRTRHLQGRLLGRMEVLGLASRSEASLEVLTSEVVQSSAIEGERLDDREVRSSVARKLGLDIAGLGPASRNVEGVVAMTLDATQRFDQPLTAERLFEWHASLFPTGRSAGRRISVGAWRESSSGPMQVVSGAMGKEVVHFEAPAPERLEAEMSRFLAWFESRPIAEPLIHTAIAHLWFVTIHPFEDGNGRIARAICDMALARADGTRERFFSLSAELERERADYYGRLEATQRGSLDITEWIEWFLGVLQRAIRGADRSLETVLRKARVWRGLSGAPVNERQRIVLNRMLGDFQGFLTTSKYAELARCSTDTALRDIQELAARGVLVKNDGGGRSTSYRIVEVLEDRP